LPLENTFANTIVMIDFKERVYKKLTKQCYLLPFLK